MRRQGFWLTGLILLIVGLTFSDTVIHIVTESWWFEAVGFASVFWRRVSWQIGIWIVTVALYVGVMGINYRVAQRATRYNRVQWLDQTDFAPYGDLLLNIGAIAVILLVSLAAATASVADWETILRFLNPSEFGQADPIYGRDIGFYLFQLPAYEALQAWLLSLVSWSLVIAIAVYLLKGAVNVNQGWRYLITGSVKWHLSILLAAIAVLAAVGFWLQRFELLYSPTGAVYGAGYTDVNARLQSYWVMGFITLALGGLLIVSLWRSGFSLPIYGGVFYIIVLVLLGGIYPSLQQQFIVEPNELAKELPYIQSNLEYTRTAYGLNQVQREDYPAVAEVSDTVRADNQATFRNIRLWDYRPLLSTYRQLQEIRAYYRFNDVDVDRYTLDGDYRQVMLSARELDTSQLSAQAQSWVNQRLKYTHGLGLAMSPVNQVTSDGLPEFFIKDIPPNSTVDLPVDETAIYYGELTRNYVITGASIDEFDFPDGDENASTRYSGAGGVAIGSFWRRLLYTAELGEFKLLISNYLTAESKLHYYRTVQDRVRHVAPFLRYDDDPYIALVDGRVQWIIDAYTVSDRYPYSQPATLTPEANTVLSQGNASEIVTGRVNYLRNAVKVVVDAYDGTMQFYVVDDTDPVIQTYQKIFPDLFTAGDQVPESVRAHFRYPQNLFTIQALMYLAYHMDSPEVFYNQEDLWRFPSESYENNQQVTTEPYYVIMRLPDESSTGEEFVTILPFTPVSKNNMIAWMAARSDGDRYGELILYEFPKQQLVYGPQQIEARVDQTPEISEQLTLWSQEGSSVIRGNLLVIPVDDSLLYVEPIYLRAEQGELPSLKRVIVAHNDQIVMRDTLDDALDAVFGDAPAIAATPPPNRPTPAPPAAASVPTPPSSLANADLATLINNAQTAYANAEVALRQGDWAAYGRYQRELKRYLDQLDQRSPGAATAPNPEPPNLSTDS